MRDRFGDLDLRQPIIHPDRNMTRELRHLTIGDEGADGDEAAVARREIGTEPEIAEQDVSRVLSNARKHRTELVAHTLCAIGLGSLVERQQRGGRCRELIGPDVSLGEDTLRY